MIGSASDIIKLLHSHRIDLSTEKRAQNDIEAVLVQNAIPHFREYRLSERDIPDFFLEQCGLAIEVKMKGAAKMAVYRQLERYAAHNEVRLLLLVTNLSMGLPPEVGGKPAHYASLGRAWL